MVRTGHIPAEVSWVTPVFKISLLLVCPLLLWGAILPDNLASIAGMVQHFLQDAFGWFYLLSVSGLVLCCVYLIFSRYGDIPLGPDDAKPEFKLVTWFSMLFCAGMGIGLVFWGVAEPNHHYYEPPMGPGETPEAARLALRYSFYHWGLHPWAIYAVVGLCLAYFQFRRQAPGLISQSCEPLFGKHTNGPVGYGIDTLAVLATLFGVATSLGFGAIQITGGLSYLSGIPNTFFTQLAVVIVVTALFMVSAQTGLHRGIKYLSNLNIVLASSLLLFLLCLGPTTFIMDAFTSTLGSYLQNLPMMSLNLKPFEDATWIHDWTLFYWAWWIAWAPFVGMFIARISKGRTVREFVLGVLLVPTIFCAFWFSVFGGTAISLEMFDHVNLKQVIDTQGKEVALFTLLGHFPFGAFMSILAMFLIGTFFITSADSATFVLGTLTTDGNLNPPNSIKFTWGIIQSVTATVLLWTGGLQALQTASIIAAFPFAIVIILMVIALMIALQKEVPAARPFDS